METLRGFSPDVRLVVKELPPYEPANANVSDFGVQSQRKDAARRDLTKHMVLSR